ncbi:MAG: hypothetical protein ACYTGL_01880 [Planctomycetota bacterium]|jgi:DNA-directed RNA polymerase subunit RPC12/RpoP
MSLIPVACHSCGAPLEVPDEARFVTCRHCGIQLEVKHNDSAAWTEQMEAIEEQTEAISERTEQLVDQVAHLQLQNAREEIDRQWDRERERFLIRQENGHQKEPSVFGAVFGASVMAVMGIVMGGAIHPAIGFLMVAIGLGAGIYGMQRAARFEQARRHYQRRKADLRIDDFRPDSGSDADGGAFTPRSTGPDFSSWDQRQ